MKGLSRMGNNKNDPNNPMIIKLVWAEVLHCSFVLKYDLTSKNYSESFIFVDKSLFSTLCIWFLNCTMNNGDALLDLINSESVFCFMLYERTMNDSNIGDLDNIL